MPKRNLIWVIALVVTAVVTFQVSRPPPPVADPVMEQLRPMAEAYRLIQDNSLLPVKDVDLLRGAAGGLAGAVDEFSTYIPADKVEAFGRRMEGKERGVGLRMDFLDGGAIVRGAMFGTPAYQAGLRAGDVLLSVNGSPVEHLTAAQVDGLLRDGPVGRTVRLEVQRADEAPRVVALVCQDTPVETVVGLYRDAAGKWVYLADPNNRAAYFRIREFTPSTMEEFQTAYRQVDGMSGLILDLRDNPGGRLPSAVDVADLFLAQGTIVTVTDRVGQSRHYVARPEGTYPADLPVVVLIDGRTASAAEIVAGALREGRRAVLVGTRTRGKGYVQSMIQLPGDLGQINLTTSEWLLGEDRHISRRAGSETWGIDPHVGISVLPAKRQRLAMLRARCELPAADEEKPSSTRRTPAAMPATTETAPNEPSIGVSLLEADAPLARAVELLRSPHDIQQLLNAAVESAGQTRQAAQRGAAPSAATQPAMGKK